MSEVKTLAITGGAAADYHKSRGISRRRGRKVMPEETTHHGGDQPPGESIASSANYNAARKLASNMKLMKGGATQTLPGSNPPNPIHLAAMPAVAANLKVGAMPPTQEAGGSKITLAPPKKKTKPSVLLAPPVAAKKHRKGIHQTRKIRVQLSGLKTRLTRAKTIHTDSREKSIADIRKVLEEAKLVKPAKEGKQVPESVLRDIYKDYLLLRNKAL